MNLQKGNFKMKKIKPNRKKRVDTCSSKIRNVFYNKVIPTGDITLVNKFNSEWGSVASQFSSGRLTIAEYEKKVNDLVSEWEQNLIIH
tara:strand:- start:4760 stop:5023 length:264 start_codon:yes stop_codon:yes gene_type:complete